MKRYTIELTEHQAQTIATACEVLARLGIGQFREQSKDAWDLYQVIRHRLSWDRAIAEGITDGKTRNWSGGMMGVNYDEPHKTSDQPLASIKDQQ